MMNNGFEQRLAEGYRLGALEHGTVLGDARTGFLGDGLHPWILFQRHVDIFLASQAGEGLLDLIVEHVLAYALRGGQVHPGRDVQAYGKTAGLGDLAAGVGVDQVQLVLADQTGGKQFLAVFGKRVNGTPQLDFFPFAVCGLVAGGVAGLAVTQNIQKHRPLFCLDELQFAFVGVRQGQWIVSVHHLGVHVFRVYRRPDAGQAFKAHGLANGLAAHAVEIVHEIEQHRQAAPDEFRPERFKLGHGGKSERFPDRAAADGRVADIGNGDAGLFGDFFVQCRTHRYVRAAAHDGVGRVDAERRKESVHGTAHAFAETGDAAENFREQTVKQEINAEFLFFAGAQGGLFLAFQG